MVETDTAGDFLLPAPTGPVTLSSSLSGPFVDVVDAFGFPFDRTIPASSPGVTDVDFNVPATPPGTAAVNTFIHVNGAHDFLTDRVPSLIQLDTPVGAVVDIPVPCLAAYDPFFGELLFCSDSGSGFPGAPPCVALSFSTVITHEYGHFVLDALSTPQDAAFGEGYADALAALVHDDPISGQDAFGPGTFGRNVDTPDVQFGCSDPDPHQCGLVLAGVWWDIRAGLGAELGDPAGLELARQLFADWTAMTTGAISTQVSAHPGTAIEVLTVDDDNGDLSDGTPHYSAICDAFLAHGIACPPVSAPDPQLVRSDCNLDSSTDLADMLHLLGWMFVPGSAAIECPDACDVDDSGALDLADAVTGLSWLFIPGSAPPAVPYPGCGVDPSADALDCPNPVCP